MGRIRFEAPLSLAIVAACVAATYLPLQGSLGIGGGLGSLLDSWTWLRLLAWPFPHDGTSHLLGNLMLFLLLSPAVEQRYGWSAYLLMLTICSLLIGLGHLAIAPQGVLLIGASGWVFMLILLSTFGTGKAGTLPLHTLLVAGLYGVQEIRTAMAANNISHFAHFLGGASGLAFGYFGHALRKGRPAG